MPSDFDQAARTLVRVLGDVVLEERSPVWVHLLEGGGEGLRLAIAPVGFPILGWRAPPECFAVGTVASGRVVSLDPEGGIPARFASASEGGARIGCVVARSGLVSWHMALPDGSEIEQAPEDGRVLDVLRRCLDLPTPAPTHPIGRLHAIAWIGAIAERAMATGSRLRWSEALSVHPAVRVCAGSMPEGDSAGADLGQAGYPNAVPAASANAVPAACPNAVPAACPNAVPGAEDLIRVASQVGTWESLRLLVASGQAWGDEELEGTAPGQQADRRGWADDLPDDSLADWMDEGMFSRWVLQGMRTTAELLELITPWVAPSVLTKLARAVQA